MSRLSAFERIPGVDISEVLFGDPAAFIQATRQGLPGEIVKQIVDAVGCRDLFVRIMGTTAGNLNRFYRRKALTGAQTEGLLDTLRVFSTAIAVFGALDIAKEWMHSIVPALGSQAPIDLCDTFKGRDLVQAALPKIEYGEFA